MTTITTSHWDPSKIRARAGQIFILPNPYTFVAPPVGTTAAAILTAYLANFYLDGNLQSALVAGLLPWATQEAKGFDLDIKFKQSSFQPCVGLAINTGKYVESCIGTTTIGEMSAAKFQDLLSSTANEMINIPATATQAAKSGVIIGATPYNNRYMVLYRWASLDLNGVPIPGQFDNVLIPRCILDTDVKLAFQQSKPTDLPVKITAENDLFLQSPDSGLYACAYFQETTSAHS